MATKLNLIGLIVKDMATTLDFYRQLGMEISEEMNAEDHVEITLPGGVRFAWDSESMIHSIDPAWKHPMGGHRVAFAFLCDTPEEVDTMYTRLIQNGAPSYRTPFNAFWGQRYAQVLDPDGNVVDLFAYL